MDIKQLKQKMQDQIAKNKREVQNYKNIIDLKELEIEELKKTNNQLKKDLKKQKEFSKMLYESP